MRSLGILVATLAVAGCGIFGRSAPQPECPNVAILGDAAIVTKFRDQSGRDLSDVTFTAEVVDIEANCSYDRTSVNVELKALLAVTRGPADRNRVVDLDYFVAITDPQQTPVAKQPFRVRFEFRDQITRLSRVEELEQRIPLRDLRLGPRYQIVIGFQLTEDELAYNRSLRQR